MMKYINNLIGTVATIILLLAYVAAMTFKLALLLLPLYLLYLGLKWLWKHYLKGFVEEKAQKVRVTTLN